MWVADQPIWWDTPNSVRIPAAIVVALVVGLRIYSTYRRSKNTRRSPNVRRIEKIVAICLWSFIALSVTLLLLIKR